MNLNAIWSALIEGFELLGNSEMEKPVLCPMGVFESN